MKHDGALHDLLLMTRILRLECVPVINYEHHYDQPVVVSVDVLIPT
jgi:hypothetical protein